MSVLVNLRIRTKLFLLLGLSLLAVLATIGLSASNAYQRMMDDRIDKLTGPPRPRGHPSPFRHNGLPRRCLNTLRSAGRPTHVREIVTAILTAKGLDPLDRALADATVKLAREALRQHERRGFVRLVGLQRARSARWALVEG